MPSRRPRIPRRPIRLGSPGRGSTLATAAVSSFPFGPPTTTTAPVLRGAVLFGAPAGARLRWRRRGRRRCSPRWGGQVVLPRSPPPLSFSSSAPVLRGVAGVGGVCRTQAGQTVFPCSPPRFPSLCGPRVARCRVSGPCRVGCGPWRGVGGQVVPRGRVGRGVKDRGQVVQGVKVGGQVVPDDKDQEQVVQDAKGGGPGVK